MRLGPRHYCEILGMLAVLAGCGGCLRSTRPQSAGENPVELPEIARGSIEANLRGLPALPQRDGIPSLELPPSPSYRALTPTQCQCLAVNAAVPARMQDEEGGLVRRQRGAELRRAVLSYTATEIRNRSAGSALEIFYHLAEAEGKADLLAQGIVELERAVRQTKEMTDQKLKPTVALDIWMRQLLTTQGDRVQADMTIAQLNGELKRLLGLTDCGDGWRIWNPESYTVEDSAIDVEAAVAEGLARRPELLLLRLVRQELSAGNLPAARELLSSVHPLLGLAPHPGIQMIENVLAILRIPIGNQAELEARRRQIDDYLRQREAAVADEVRQAAAGVRYRARLVALAWAREQSWQEKVREVQGRQKQGLASFAETTQASLELLKVRAEVIQEVMAWEISWVKLRQAKGLLAAECLADSGPTHCR